ncbi:MAG: hypothetical protein MRY83_03210 [Flavobacteriales bacterium]|nr:hypothetical protein [Flavobacteriales bacterium]
MNQNIPNIYVFILLFIITAIFGTFMYSKTIGVTKDLLSEYDNLNSQLNENIDFEFEIKKTQKQIDAIDEVISLNKEDVGSIQNGIIQDIKDKGKQGDIAITQVPKPHMFTELQYDIVTNVIECNGDFIALVKLVDYFERNFKRAKLSSVEFEVRKNIKSKKRKLYAKLYFQNIQK